MQVERSPNQAAKVLIDASSVTGTPDGLSTYIVQLIRHLPAAAQDLEFTALLNPGVSRPDLDEALVHGGMKQIREPMAAIGPRRDWQMMRLLPQLRQDYDLIHITAMTYPFALSGGVCTIHDLTYRKWFHGGLLWRSAAKFYLDFTIRRCATRADAIIAVSDQTRRDIADLVGVTPERLPKATVIHEGWEHMQSPAQGEPLPDTVPRGDFLFFLGTNRAHKNLSNLLEAFGRVLPQLPPEKKLVITGSSARLDDAQKRLVSQINAAGERVAFTGFVSDAAVAELYKRADAFVFPSKKEGFGLPILEAFYHRTPLLAADAPAIPEVAGDGALYFDPFDVDSIAGAILKFYSDAALGTALVKKGSERLRDFSWAKAARETVAVYRSAIGRAGPSASASGR